MKKLSNFVFSFHKEMWKYMLIRKTRVEFQLFLLPIRTAAMWNFSALFGRPKSEKLNICSIKTFFAFIFLELQKFRCLRSTRSNFNENAAEAKISNCTWVENRLSLFLFNLEN